MATALGIVAVVVSLASLGLGVVNFRSQAVRRRLDALELREKSVPGIVRSLDSVSQRIEKQRVPLALERIATALESQREDDVP
ncbi:hypothetical protein NBH00_12795 [Paraconexibacter antarcticus]|uniref:Uncharacterized protein n=1 Tax=Paraconexibacter antarcticus TaxID=2949664 RepID=A0ABY5DLC3_9ACTN|nr:hypothetical protein [Paraconexibacter antarcticus]UTI62246.1 hypothetical protein NBH00_12795 [Paraconexibacter antarcticus]